LALKCHQIIIVAVVVVVVVVVAAVGAWGSIVVKALRY
jgi:hypothetical protein